MSTHVTLIVTETHREQQRFEFHGPARCLVGRASDCDIQLASDLYHMNVSRHHCLFEFDASSIRVSDLGSLNGTFVKGRRIGGSRHRRDTDSAKADDSEVEVLDGDEVHVGPITIRVAVDVTSELVEPALSTVGMK